MRCVANTAIATVLVLGLALPAAAQQQPNREQMQERMQQMQERMQQGGTGYGMMGHGMMGPGMMMGRGGRGGMMGGMTMGPGMMGGGMMMGPGRFVEGRLAFLKTELDITAEQESVWDAFAEAMRGNAGSMQAMHERMWSGEGWPESLPERMALHEELMSERLAALRSMREALEPLYEALGPEQREVANALMGVM